MRTQVIAVGSGGRTAVPPAGRSPRSRCREPGALRRPRPVHRPAGDRPPQPGGQG